MSKWEKEFSLIRIIVMAIYSTVFIYILIVNFRVGAVEYIWEQTQQILFYALIVMIAPVFIASYMIGKRMIAPEKIIEKFYSVEGTENGLSAAVALVRSGAIVMAAIGETCAIYGLVIYLMSGDTTRPLFFFAMSLLHYPVTMMQVGKTKETIAKLDRERAD